MELRPVSTPCLCIIRVRLRKKRYIAPSLHDGDFFTKRFKTFTTLFNKIEQWPIFGKIFFLNLDNLLSNDRGNFSYMYLLIVIYLYIDIFISSHIFSGIHMLLYSDDWNIWNMKNMKNLEYQV